MLPGRNAPSCAYDAHKSQFAHRLVLHAAGTSVDLQDAANHIDQRTFGVGSLGGTPVFKGTRVSVRTLFEYLADGLSLEYFLESFPSVTREQAADVLRLSQKRIEQEIAA